MSDTTPRPWHRRDSDIEDGANNLVARMHRGAHVRADAALIVAAVNDYDRLRAIEEAAREVLTELDIIRADKRGATYPRLMVHIDTHNALTAALRSKETP